MLAGLISYVQDGLAHWQDVWHSPQPPFFSVFCKDLVFRVLMLHISVLLIGYSRQTGFLLPFCSVYYCSTEFSKIKEKDEKIHTRIANSRFPCYTVIHREDISTQQHDWRIPMKLLFLGASNTDCGHCFSKDNLGYGYVKMVHDLLLQKAQKDCPSEMSLSTSDSSVQIKADHSGTPGNLPKGICTSTVIINGGTDGFTFPRILRKWEQSWKRTAFDAVFILGGINEVGALMDSGMDETSHRVLLQRSAVALSALLSGLSASGCPQIFVLEPFLFDTPQYLKSWMGTLRRYGDDPGRRHLFCLHFLVYVLILASMTPIICLPMSLSDSNCSK